MKNLSFITSIGKRILLILTVLTICVGQADARRFIWDLTKASYQSASTSTVTWSSGTAYCASMTFTKNGNSNTAVNNYLGNGSDQLESRIYNGNKLTITPMTGSTITSVIITCTSTYSAGFASSWTNATKSITDDVVTVTPTDGTSAFYVVIGSGGARITQVEVIYNSSDIVVTDPGDNVLDDYQGYDFGTVNTTSGSVTLHVEGVCIDHATDHDPSSNFYMQAFPQNDPYAATYDGGYFKVNGSDNLNINTSEADITLSYTGLDEERTFEAQLWIWAYKSSTCTSGSVDDECVWVLIPISVTYEEPPIYATPDPTSWDFGNVEVNSTQTKTFTISTYGLTGNLTVGMNSGSVGMTVSPNSISKNASSTTITVTFTPTTEGLKEDKVVISGGGLASNTEIPVTGTGVITYTVHWYVNGALWEGAEHGNPATTVLKGARPSPLPTAPDADDYCGSAFMGWTDHEITGSSGEPSPLFKSLAPVSDRNKTFHAVFADENP